MMTRRARLLILISATVFFLEACNSWPPEKGRLTAQFSERNGALNTLADAFADSEFLSWNHGGVNSEVYVTDDRGAPRRAVDGEDGLLYRQLLEDAGAYGILREGNKVVVMPYFNNLQSDRIVTANFIKGLRFSEGEDCALFSFDSKNVECLVALDNEWVLGYTWE